MVEIIILILLIMLSAFFAIAETALTTISNLKIAHLVETKKPGAKTLRRLREDPAKLLSTVLVGNNLVNISASALATVITEKFLEKIGMGSTGLAIGIAIGIMTFFILVFGEITPKTVAIRKAVPLALWLSPVMVIFEILLYPIVYFLNFVSRPLVGLFVGQGTEKIPLITEEEIQTILATSEREGVIEHEERELLTGVFKFGDLIVTQVMTPRDRMNYVKTEDKISDAIKMIKESGHSRLPVIEDSLDNVSGIIYAKDLLEVHKNDRVKDHLRQALYIPRIRKINDLLEQMQEEYKHMAIVVDEYGHTEGLVTLEDLIEEIVGEIHDEYERIK